MRLFGKDRRDRGHWIESEDRKTFEGGGSVLRKGYRCPFCNNFIHIKRGKENYCHNCGADLREERAA